MMSPLTEVRGRMTEDRKQSYFLLLPHFNVCHQSSVLCHLP